MRLLIERVFYSRASYNSENTVFYSSSIRDDSKKETEKKISVYKTAPGYTGHVKILSVLLVVAN